MSKLSTALLRRCKLFYLFFVFFENLLSLCNRGGVVQMDHSVRCSFTASKVRLMMCSLACVST